MTIQHSDSVASYGQPTTEGARWPVPFRIANATNATVTLAVAVLTVLWALVNLANGWTGFAAVVPTGFRGGGEAAISLARLFAALVLVLIARGETTRRLLWVAAGFFVLGTGQLVFGYLAPILEQASNANDAIYQMVFVRTLAAALFIVGLVPAVAPRGSRRVVTGIVLVALGTVAAYLVLNDLRLMPDMVRMTSLGDAARLRIAPLSWLTPWHWVFAAVPFALAVIAAAAAMVRRMQDEVPVWLPLALVLLAASELHDSLWPSAYGTSMVMNTADVLRLEMAALVAVGGVVELRRIAVERSALLAAGQERTRRLEELTALKADFTAMVAHELGHPLSAIRRQAELLTIGNLPADLEQRAIATILQETDVLDARVADIQTTATVERDDFQLETRPLTIGAILDDARAIVIAAAERDRLRISLSDVAPTDQVLADAGRLAQVLRNLLSNAFRFAPPGSPVTLEVEAISDDQIAFAVSDCGPGVRASDRLHIFGKFARGRGARQTPGTGLGLYISQRIVRAHGGRLTVDPTADGGARFVFTLPTVKTGTS